MTKTKRRISLFPSTSEDLRSEEDKDKEIDRRPRIQELDIDFDTQKVFMDREYVYRNGDPARILCVDSEDPDFPVVSLTPSGIPRRHYANGRKTDSSGYRIRDLQELKEFRNIENISESTDVEDTNTYGEEPENNIRNEIPEGWRVEYRGIGWKSSGAVYYGYCYTHDLFTAEGLRLAQLPKIYISVDGEESVMRGETAADDETHYWEFIPPEDYVDPRGPLND